jgi:hypothetical protein
LKAFIPILKPSFRSDASLIMRLLGNVQTRNFATNTLFPAHTLVWAVSGSSLVFLALLGSLSAKAGGAPIILAAARVMFWGALAMLLTAGVGRLIGGPV